MSRRIPELAYENLSSDQRVKASPAQAVEPSRYGRLYDAVIRARAHVLSDGPEPLPGCGRIGKSK